MELAKRVKNLPPYLFAQIDKKIAQKKAGGVDIISLGIGDPDRPTPEHIVEELCRQAHNPATHRYPDYYGLADFRESIARWYKRRFNVDLNPGDEVLPLIGSKEGLAHICLAYIDPGDIALVPDPAYPVYNIGTILCNGLPYFMPLRAKNNFLPDLDAIPSEIANKAKIMFLNYPNNPTAALADKDFFQKVVSFAQKYGIVICHDFPYSEITYDGYKAPSFLEIEGAKDIGIEFNSLSKMYNMTGWRIGFALGNKKIIEALGTVKTNIDSGIFNAIQYAGIAALEGNQKCIEGMVEIYRERRDILVEGFNSMGWNLEKPKATIYVWIPTPEGKSSEEFATLLIEKAGVVVPPGNAYGKSGEGYIRAALTVEKERIEEAIERIKKII